MFGLEIEFKCKNCGKSQNKCIGGTPKYKINDSKCDYIPVRCSACNTLHYIAVEATIIDEDSEEVKERAFEKVKKLIGDSEKSKEWFYKHTTFITKDKEIIHHSEVHTIKEMGVAMY